MTRQSKRRHPRIRYQGKVDIHCNGQGYLGCSVQNLSIIGMWVSGCHNLGEGDRCDIEFHDAAPAGNREIRMKGEVLRRDGDGAAILFLNLNVRTCNDLESLITAQGGPPLTEANEFLDSVPA